MTTLNSQYSERSKFRFEEGRQVEDEGKFMNCLWQLFVDLHFSKRQLYVGNPLWACQETMSGVPVCFVDFFWILLLDVDEKIDNAAHCCEICAMHNDGRRKSQSRGSLLEK